MYQDVDQMAKCPMCQANATIRQIGIHVDQGCPPESSTEPTDEGEAVLASNMSVSAVSNSGKAETLAPIFLSKPIIPQKRVSMSPRVSPDKKQKVPELFQAKKAISDPFSSESDITTQGLTASIIKTNSAPKKDSYVPLAELARPKQLNDFIGQTHILGPGGCLTSYIEEDRCPSIILWGPPGIGKTTIARILARATRSRFVELSATDHGTNECRLVFKQALDHRRLTGQKTILFLDEIHRFNKSQQDIFLPVVESGDIILVGATTDNPSFKLNKALTSRCQLLTLNKLTLSDIHQILIRASDVYNRHRAQNGLKSIFVSDEIFLYLSGIADGDSRNAINLLEMAMKYMSGSEIEGDVQEGLGDDQEPRYGVSLDDIKDALTRSHVIYDRAGDSHYDTISAFHKAIRGSNADAAVFYLMRMLHGGEDPLFIARRMTRIASEDIGLADESCLTMALTTFSAITQIGMPEADCIMVQCCIKLARAPKSVMVYRALNKAKEFCARPEIIAKKVPVHMGSLSTILTSELGEKTDVYKYNPDYLNGTVKQEYMPEGLEDIKFIEDMHLGTKIDPDLK